MIYIVFAFINMVVSIYYIKRYQKYRRNIHPYIKAGLIAMDMIEENNLQDEYSRRLKEINMEMNRL